MTTDSLLQFLQQETDSLFATVLPSDAAQQQPPEVAKHYSTVEQVWKHSYELHFAIKELDNRGISLESELEASLEFVFGLDDYISDRIHPALNHFQQSLEVWQKLAKRNIGGDEEDADFSRDLENLSPNFSPARREALNSPHSLVGKGAGGLGFALAFPHDVKSQEEDEGVFSS
ncbi:MAG: hypothetical protein ACYT04_68320, partial [Nostoc sp.]